MPFTNVTTVTQFLITGFPGLQPWYYEPVSVLLVFVYLAIVLGNSFVLFLVAKERSLQKPTYLIFCNLAMSDIAFATTTLPKTITRYAMDDPTISFPACFLQMFFVHLLGSFNSMLLMLMALDRYIAICNPLRYQALIKNSTILTMCGLSWLIATACMVFIVVQAASLPYCDSNLIVQCYCDHIGITRLACQKVREAQTAALSAALSLLLAPLSFVIFSYARIIFSVMKIASWEGRYKTFSTCSPQLFIICLYYIPRCFVYITNFMNVKFSVDVRILMIMLYSLFPPVVNPWIYCFRTKDIKEVLSRRLKARKVVTATRQG